MRTFVFNVKLINFITHPCPQFSSGQFCTHLEEMPTELNVCSPSHFWGRNMTVVPQRAAVTATAGVQPQPTLTMTRNLDSVLIEVSER